MWLPCSDQGAPRRTTPGKLYRAQLKTCDNLSLVIAFAVVRFALCLDSGPVCDTVPVTTRSGLVYLSNEYEEANRTLRRQIN